MQTLVQEIHKELEKAALESDGNDVATLQDRVSMQHTLLQRLIAAATSAMTAHTALKGDFEARLQSRNRRFVAQL